MPLECLDPCVFSSRTVTNVQFRYKRELQKCVSLCVLRVDLLSVREQNLSGVCIKCLQLV